MLAAGLTLLVSLAAGDTHCTLNGDGDVDLCEKVYWRSRLISLAIPAYVFQTDGVHAHHGLQWTLAIDVPKDEWNEYFSLGVDKASLPHGFPFQIGAAASFLWFPNSSLEARIVLRARIMSLVGPSLPANSFLHLTIGAGAAASAPTTGGTKGVDVAPRIEARLRVGHIAWGGLVLAAGFQPYIYKEHYVGDVSVGVEAPWVWWW